MISLTEKYRPQDWNEVKGQEPVISALKDILAKAKEPISLVYSDKVESTDKVKPPHMLFIGTPGTGKTTVAKIFAKHYGAEFVEFNASDDRGLEVFRDKIKRLANLRMSEIIYLNEADGLTGEFQQALRSTMETSKNATFILDVNNESKIIDPIKSRCTEFKFKPLSSAEVIERLSEICKREGIKTTKSEEETKVFPQIYNSTKGDMRKAINELEKVITSNKELNFKNLGIVEETTDKSFTKTDNGVSDTMIPEGWQFNTIEQTYNKEIEIKLHNSVAKGNMYKYGRIQLTVPISWVGLNAKITIKLKEP